MSFSSKLAFTLGQRLGPYLIRAFGLTWRVRWNGLRYYARRKSGLATRVVYAFWHCNILLLGYEGRGEGSRILISQHRDGELIARVVQRLGFTVFRGSTTRGGMKAMRSLDKIKADPSGCDIGITPDGPKGPARKLQKGVIFTASRTGFPIVPLGCAVDRCWEMGSWDRFRVPKPFCRAYVHIGPEIVIPENLDEQAMACFRSEVEQAMYRADEEANQALSRWKNGNKRKNGEQ